ncbi:MAG TPA: dipeptidase [Trueperaceae bacterium]|nr:dipeptidase [Trueperaceae bacterium]
MIPVFDGHNDTLLMHLERPERDFFARQEDGHIDYARAREGGFAGGFFAMFPPTRPGGDPFAGRKEVKGGYTTPPSPPVDELYAVNAVHRMFRILYQLTADGRVRLVTTADALQESLDDGTLAAIAHFEGAEAVDPELAALDVYYRAGLRSLGIVWSRANAFGHGVPFGFPSSPDTGPGLTAAGRRLVTRCNDLGIMVDLSHITERGFWDAAELTSAPLVATHSNAHAICPSPRNLTDEQLEAVRQSDGMVGLNFAVGFLDPDGSHDADLDIEVMVRHIDHLVDKLGVDRVGFGSDFDGARISEGIHDVAGVQRLVEALREHGYDEPSLRKLAHENWVRVLRKTWKA